MSWVDLIAVADLEAGWVTPAAHETRPLAVYDSPAGIFVTSALCSHAGADLCTGYFTGQAIECPLHQALFDIKTGAPIGAPASRPIKTYLSRIRDGMVQISVDGQTS